jgi:hypothetical protein
VTGGSTTVVVVVDVLVLEVVVPEASVLDGALVP